MLLGDLLVANGVVSRENVREATERQKTAGGLLGENLIALEVVTAEKLQDSQTKRNESRLRVSAFSFGIPSLFIDSASCVDATWFVR